MMAARPPAMRPAITGPVAIRSDRLRAEVDPLGAELVRLADAEGRELLWEGDPAWWTGRSPLLFPIVGALNQDRLRLGGAAYPMAKHGFARKKPFALIRADGRSATFILTDDAETRAAYPFAFDLVVRYALDGPRLTIAAEIANRGERPLPAAFGFHPAFRWPLPYGGDKADHRLAFERPEPAPIRRLDRAGLVEPDPRPTPVEGDALPLRDALFEADALIFDRLESRRLTYGVPGRPGLEIGFEGMPQLGVWMKPGAGYLCIEPWRGFADPVGFEGDFHDKPGVFVTRPGEAARLAMTVTLIDRA